MPPAQCRRQYPASMRTKGDGIEGVGFGNTPRWDILVLYYAVQAAFVESWTNEERFIVGVAGSWPCAVGKVDLLAAPRRLPPGLYFCRFLIDGAWFRNA